MRELGIRFGRFSAYRIKQLMTQQPSLFSREASASPQPPDGNPAPKGEQPAHGQGEAPHQVPRWLRYLELSVRVVVRLYLGLVLVFLPWTHFWSDDRLLVLVPHLSVIALNGITRGVVSGLGLLNIWIGVDDAIHFKEG